jgi:hypothetical protein
MIGSHGRVFALVRRGSCGEHEPCSLATIWNEASTPSLSSDDDDIIFAASGLGGDFSSDSAPWGLRNVLALLAVGGVGRPVSCEAEEGRLVRVWVMGSGGSRSPGTARGGMQKTGWRNFMQDK